MAHPFETEYIVSIPEIIGRKIWVRYRYMVNKNIHYRKSGTFLLYPIILDIPHQYSITVR